MECIAIINQKGGVGKTSTAVNLGAAFAQRGRRMLLIDLDPQGHLTTHFGLDGVARGAGIYEVLTRSLPFEKAIHVYSPTISVVPAQVELAAAEVELVSVVGREVILRDHLASREWPYDIVVLDCPPSLGVLSLNALAAANRVLIPVQPHFLALQGTGKLFETIALVQQRLNTRLTVAGMVICLHEAGTRLSGEVIDDLSQFLETSRNSPVPWRLAKIFETRIRRNVKLAECPSYGQSIFEYAPRSNGAIDYLGLADEMLAYMEGRAFRPAAANDDAQSSDAATPATPGANGTATNNSRAEQSPAPAPTATTEPATPATPAVAIVSAEASAHSTSTNPPPSSSPGTTDTSATPGDADIPRVATMPRAVSITASSGESLAKAAPVEALATAASHRRAAVPRTRQRKPAARKKPSRIAPSAKPATAPESSAAPVDSPNANVPTPQSNKPTAAPSEPSQPVAPLTGPK